MLGNAAHHAGDDLVLLGATKQSSVFQEFSPLVYRQFIKWSMPIPVQEVRLTLVASCHREQVRGRECRCSEYIFKIRFFTARNFPVVAAGNQAIIIFLFEIFGQRTGCAIG